MQLIYPKFNYQIIYQCSYFEVQKTFIETKQHRIKTGVMFYTKFKIYEYSYAAYM